MYQEKCKKIWEGYRLYSATAYVIRKGFELVGLSEVGEIENVKNTFLKRGESVLEHQAKTAWLCGVFASNFVDFFDGNDMSLADFWYLTTVLLCHDVGEVAIGDIPDDGGAARIDKDVTELKVLLGFTEAYDNVDSCILLDIFRSFQVKDTKYGEALYALDKLEAVMTLLLLERNGHTSVNLEKKYLTEADRYYMELTGTNCAADCWAAHLVVNTKGFSDVVTRPVLTLLETAMIDVRGGLPEWYCRLKGQKEHQ